MTWTTNHNPLTLTASTRPTPRRNSKLRQVKEIEFNLNKATAKGLQTITTTEDREDVQAGAGRTRSGSLTANSSASGERLLKREVSETNGARVDGRAPGSLGGGGGGVGVSAVDENVFGRRRSSSITQRAEAEEGSNNYHRPACLKIVGTVDGYGLGAPEWWM